MDNKEINFDIDEVMNSINVKDLPMSELSLDELDEVSGGKIKVAGYAILTAAVALLSSRGVGKERGIAEIVDGWNSGCEFKDRYTDGTAEDLQDVINYLNKIWPESPEKLW